MDRKAYPSDVSDEEWALVAPYLTLMIEDAPQRDFPLREVFNGLRWIVRTGAHRKGSKVHLAVDTLGHLLALCVTAADEQDRAQVSELAKRMQEETGETVEIAFVDQGYTGENAADAAGEHGVKLEVAPLPTAKKGLVLSQPRLTFDI
jgi:transposase